jgi:hypothetical protein
MYTLTDSKASIVATRLLSLLALVLLAGACGGDPPPAPPEDGRQAELLILVYDRSSSISEHELEHYQEATRSRLNDLHHGDHLVAFEILEQSLAESPTRWASSVPEREFSDRVMQRDSVTRARYLQDARDYLTRFTNSEDREPAMGTDILSTLHLVANEVAGYPEHRATVVLFSDMLQANEVMNMEGLVRMPSANWIQNEANAGTLPDLSGVCVVVVGARVDTQASQRVRAFWEEYFETTGATLLDRNYQYRAVRIPARPCG